MKLSVSRDVRMLSLAFMFIFLGYNGVQQYVTAFFSDAGLVDLGFQSLILVYFSMILSAPLAAVASSRYGAKKCMVFSSLFYSLYIILLVSKSAPLIYIGSCLLGLAASFLWLGENCYLIRASERRSYGESTGFFSSLQQLGSAIGIIALGFLAAVIMPGASFLAFSIFPVLGFLLLCRLGDSKPGRKVGLGILRKSFGSRTALRLSFNWFAISFVYGLSIGIIPLAIMGTLGISYIGILLSLFYILPVIFSYFFGRLSDTRGRMKMVAFSYAFILAGLASLYLSSIPVLLVLGTVFLAMSWAVIFPVNHALYGDVSREDRLESMSTLFGIASNLGIITALVISSAFRLEASTIYVLSAIVIAASLVVFLPLLLQGTEKIREKISQEAA
jgi:MFS family permease